MNVGTSSSTARQAADEFAARYCDGGRKVGVVINHPGAAMAFQFVGGNRWYLVRCRDDYEGWEVIPESEAA
jgi:hypothetical protein